MEKRTANEQLKLISGRTLATDCQLQSNINDKPKQQQEQNTHMLEVKRWRISKSTTSPGPHCLNTYIGIFVFCKLQIKTYWTGFKLSLTIKSWENHFHTRLSHILKIIRAYMSKLESEPRAIKAVVDDETEEHLSSFWLFWLRQIPTVWCMYLQPKICPPLKTGLKIVWRNVI